MNNFNLLKILFFSIVFFVLISCKKECQQEVNCDNDVPEWCNLVDLSNEVNPVCGCDCVTYQNAGYAECVGGVSSYTE